MHAVHEGGAGDVRAALAWWVEAGVDTLVDDVPRRWLAPEPAATPRAGPLTAARADPAPPLRPARTPSESPPPALVDPAALAGARTLAELRALIAGLRAEPLLFADGAEGAPLMVVGEAVTAEDLAAGRLHAGAAGLLLDRMLAAIGRGRGDTYLAAAHYWPLPAGRPPEPAETAATAPLIRRHVALARPRAVLALGAAATAALTGAEAGLGRLRGRWQALELDGAEVPLLPSFSPAYLLAHPAHKAMAWTDLQALAARLAQ